MSPFCVLVQPLAFFARIAPSVPPLSLSLSLSLSQSRERERKKNRVNILMLNIVLLSTIVNYLPLFTR